MYELVSYSYLVIVERFVSFLHSAKYVNAKNYARSCSYNSNPHCPILEKTIFNNLKRTDNNRNRSETCSELYLSYDAHPVNITVRFSITCNNKWKLNDNMTFQYDYDKAIR